MEYFPFDSYRRRFTIEEPSGFWTRKRKKALAAFSILLLLTTGLSFLIFQKLQVKPAPIVTSGLESYDIPPKLPLPQPVTLPFPQSICANSPYHLSGSLSNGRFENCVITISGTNLVFENIEFINSPVMLEEVSNVFFHDVVFSKIDGTQNFPKRAESPAAVIVDDSNKIVFDHVLVSENLNGVLLNTISGVEIKNSFFEKNMGEKGALWVRQSTAIKVHDNVFRNNHPLGLFLSNKDGNPDPFFEVYRNYFNNNVVYGLIIEDWQSRLVSRIFNNVLIGGRGAGITIQRHSNPANINILYNYIGKKASCDSLSQILNPAIGTGWCFANSDGVKLEDTETVLLRGNILIENERSGLDLREAKDIRVLDNTFVKNAEYGIFSAASSFDSENNTFLSNGSNVHEQSEPEPEVIGIY